MDQDEGNPTGAKGLINTGPSSAAPPPVAAAFLVKFDNRKGYTLAWQRSEDGLDIEGVVEFKSLPSGLHNVKEDLVYFVHEQYAGVSAFLNREDVQDDRKARMLAIGVLVPLESGRMGKSWLHAEHLKELCREQADKKEDYSLLEKYWDKYKQLSSSPVGETNGSASGKGPSMKIDIPKRDAGYQASQPMSTNSMPSHTSHTLSAHHPALALPRFLNLFGPLILPLFRAALLRKRILFLGEAPVEQMCNYVYNLSILSSVPRTIAESIFLESPHDLRLQPLFNVGISDIPFLSAGISNSSPDSDEKPGWVACTTDDVLCTKPDLFDILVILPNANSLHPSSRQYPKIIYSSPELSRAYPKYGLRATQRDARRYATLARGLRVFSSSLPTENSAIADDDIDDERDEVSSTASVASAISRKSIVEPASWSRIAYTSLVWWASAGDKRTGLTETEESENEQDVALLSPDSVGVDDDPEAVEDGEDGKTREVATVSYFHRLSGLVFRVLEDAVKRTDGDHPDRYHDDPGADNDEVIETEQRSSPTGSLSSPPSKPQNQPDGQQEENEALLSTSPHRSDDLDADNGDQEPVEITPEDFSLMGLDIWNSSDQKFIEEMTSFWFGREAVVLGGKVECCGMKLM